MDGEEAGQFILDFDAGIAGTFNTCPIGTVCGSAILIPTVVDPSSGGIGDLAFTDDDIFRIAPVEDLLEDEEDADGALIFANKQNL